MRTTAAGFARSALVLLAAALLIVGGVAWWLLRDRGPATDVARIEAPEARANETPLAQPAEAAPLAPRRIEAQPVPLAPVPAATLDLDVRPPPESFVQELSGVRGRLVEEDGTPVADLRVELLRLEIDLVMATVEGGFTKIPPQLANPVIGSAVSAADGTFLLRDVESTPIMVLGVDLGGGRCTARLVDESFRRGETVDLGDVILPPHVVLTGTIVDDDGEPVAGARVRVVPELPWPVPPQVLQAGVTDIRSDAALLLSYEIVRTKFEMPPALRFVFDRLPIPTGRTQSDGTFRVAGVPAGLVTVMADHPGHLGVARAVPTGRRKEAGVGTLGLGAGRSVTGTVLAGETPLAGARLYVGSTIPIGELLGAMIPGAESPEGVAVAVGQRCEATDGAGRFTIAGLPDFGEVLCALQPRTGDPWQIHGPFPAGDALELRLPPETTLEIAVKDAAGAPVREAEFRFVERSPANELPFLFEPAELRGRVAEREPGVYVARELPVGKWQVIARAPGYGIGDASVELAAEGGTVAITLGAAADLEVRVSDAATGEPVDYALAAALSEFESAFVQPFTAARSDERGMATLRALPAAERLYVRVRHPGYTRAYAEVTPERLALGTPLEMALTRGGDLVGRVTTQGEPPVKPVMILAEFRDDISRLPENEMPRFGLTAADGTFAIRHLQAGRWRYNVFPRFLAEGPQALLRRAAADLEPEELAQGDFTIAEGQETQLEIEALPDVPMVPASLFGEVRLHGERVAGAQIQLTGRRWNNMQADEHGAFRFDDLRPGRYVVIVRGGGQRGNLLLHREAIQLGSGEQRELRVDARLTAQEVTVRRADGSPAAGVQVHAVAGSGSGAEEDPFGMTYSGSSDGEGKVFLELLPGPYDLVAVSDELGRGRTRVDVGDQPGRAAEITMAAGIHFTARIVVEGGEAPQEGQSWHFYIDPRFEIAAADRVAMQNWREVDPADPRVELKNVVPGTYHAMLWGSGDGRMLQTELEIPPGGASDAVIRFGE